MEKREVLEKAKLTARKIFLLPVHLYRRLISPLFPPVCKYCPSCSRYAVDAVMKHGIIVGTALAGWRLLRCNPWSLGGIDPVPEKIVFRKKTCADNAQSR